MAKFVKLTTPQGNTEYIAIDKIVSIVPRSDAQAEVITVDEISSRVAHTPDELIAMIEEAEGGCWSIINQAESDPYRWRMWPDEKPEESGLYRVSLKNAWPFTEDCYYRVGFGEWGSEFQSKVRCWQIINNPPREA